MRHDASLDDRYDLDRGTILLNGTQALVRLMLMQRARDAAAGMRTAGYVTGYRGSPLGGVDMQMSRAAPQLAAADIRFHPGLNEDLAATAAWGTQQAGIRGEGVHDGVFTLFYSKGPGIDRSGDVLRHANLAGTAPKGGVLAALGDDHTGESSTTCHQSEWAMLDAQIPVLSPAGVQEILDLGLYGFALSRASGLWAGLKLMKDTVEVTGVIDGRADRMTFVLPDRPEPSDGLHIRAGDHWVPQEERLHEWKVPTARAFARANRIDRRGHGRPGARIGLVGHGKNWLDLIHALSLLGLDATDCDRIGLTTYKVAQVWPLDVASLHEWADGLDLIVVVEEKRKLLEIQIKEALFGLAGVPRVWGYRDAAGNVLFPQHGALDPANVAAKLGRILVEEGRCTDRMADALVDLRDAADTGSAPDLAKRTPYFCAGCPHNTSTTLPAGARSGGGIGCHTMALWMERGTEGYTHMGAEGANWVGEGPFSTRPHVFQNMGDGTYNHSGILAIRAALGSGANITFKILFNDAVALTGGQGNDGGLTPQRVAAELLAMGVKRVAIVHDPAEELDRAAFPEAVGWHPRDDLAAVQRKMQSEPGVTAIVYVQTCAAEKRRRRRHGTFPTPATRVFIDPDVCEGCGDCGVQSNCVALLPIETPFGTKRVVDQSACNVDLNCLKGFCPSFVTMTGGSRRASAMDDLDLSGLPDPAKPAIRGTWNVVATGIGGTGIVTVGAVLTMAAYLDGKAAACMEMAGLAQKGGAVHLHLRFAQVPEDIAAVRVSAGEADLLIGADALTAATRDTLRLLRPGRTSGVVNAHLSTTGRFTRDPDFRLPEEAIGDALRQRLGNGFHALDATALAERVMGDTIFANLVLTGAAWQRGLVPVSAGAMRRAIELNGRRVDASLRAFELGRWAVTHPARADRIAVGDAPPPQDPVERCAAHLEVYGGVRLAQRYKALVEGIDDAVLRDAVARGYHKLLAYKDEYEVARLLAGTHAKVAQEWNGAHLSYHLAPPLLARSGSDGRPAKRTFGRWIEPLFPLLARGRVLRGTPFDPFRYAADRRMERALITEYERDIASVLPILDEGNRSDIIELALLPLSIRGFGPVKAANGNKAAARRATLLRKIRDGAGGYEVAAE
ncbi:indolepyruvate ferredoxin oxidoreductase family protein [Jannaschia sp. LMIT008]|uniref:indolepyruvate ferredoxin oxidoreductase family protein n=1 Tax=Jannaschia maritima TaxID=3032585 RepID=UPI0028112C53|nr:indolepyruvate ferredoxin oxidoreductase family protein [Jannaschia sp. LMIT008]